MVAWTETQLPFMDMVDMKDPSDAMALHPTSTVALDAKFAQEYRLTQEH
jgi:hypothetical protein